MLVRSASPLTRLGHRLAWPIATVVATLVAMAQALQIWQWRPGQPVEIDGDAASVTAWVAAILNNGDLADEPRLGAPFGQNRAWLATGDTIHALIIRALGLIWHDPFTVSALYFFIGFPLAALSMYALARSERLRPLTAAMISVLFAVLPAHQSRFAHLFLAAYWVVPLGAWLALKILHGRALFGSQGHGRPRGWREVLRHPATRTVLVMLVVGLSGVYYVAFALILIAGALLARLVRHYDRRLLLHGLGTIALVGATTVAVLLPALIRTRADLLTGSAPDGRGLADSEMLGGRLIDLILPWSQHRVPILGLLTQGYDYQTGATMAEDSAIGVVALTGLIALTLIGLAMLVPHGPPRRFGRLPSYAVLAAVAFAFYTKGGAGAAFALFISPQIRTWSRLYVTIALFGLLAVGYLLDRWASRRAAVAGIATVLVGLLGVADQTNPAVAPAYAATAARFQVIAEHTARLEQQLPSGCAVFQLPIIPFPGAKPLHGLKDYDLELPYLASHDLAWSYGGMAGTARADWQNALPTGDPRALLDQLAAVGFCAVQVDTAGYADVGSSPVPQLQSLLGAALSSTTDGRLVAFDLRRWRTDLLAAQGSSAVATLAERTLQPVLVDVTGGPVQAADADSRVPYQSIGTRAAVNVRNLGDSPVEVTVTFTVTGTGTAARTVTITTPDGRTTDATVTATAGHLFTVRVIAARGTSAAAIGLTGALVGSDPSGSDLSAGRVSVVSATTVDPQVHLGVLQARPAT